MAIINFNSISGVSTISVASSITVGNNVSIGTDRVTATTFSGNLTGNVTGTVNSSGIATFTSGIIVAAGTTAAPSISPTGDSNTGIFFPSADTIAFGEGGAEAARFDSSGRLGIGTANPSNLIHLYSTSDGAELLQLEIGAQPVSSEKAKIIWRATQTNGQSAKLASIGSTAVSNWGGEFQIFTKPANGTPNDTILERVRIDNAGRMTSPYQPAFRATFSTSYTVAVNTEMVPSTIVTNIGSHYSNTTGRFTAPVAGMYHFSFNVRFNAVSYYNFTFRLNGNITSYYESVGSASASTNDGYSNSIYLNAGDYVSLFNGSTGGLSSDSFASFSGFLIG